MRTAINFKIKFENHISDICTYEGEYRSLIVLIKDKFYVECFGECGGVGRCGTCVVKIINEVVLEVDERNEATTLQKKGIFDAHIRLACQIPITQELSGALFEILPEE